MTTSIVILKNKKGDVRLEEQLQKNLDPHGYHPIPNIVGLWKHKTKPIQF